MERTFENLGAKVVPVLVRVKDVDVPSLVDRMGRRDRVPCGDP
jgi:hypothetical protein